MVTAHIGTFTDNTTQSVVASQHSSLMKCLFVLIAAGSVLLGKTHHYQQWVEADEIVHGLPVRTVINNSLCVCNLSIYSPIAILTNV